MSISKILFCGCFKLPKSLSECEWFFLYFLCSCQLTTSKMKLKKKEEKGEEGSFEYAFKKTLVNALSKRARSYKLLETSIIPLIVQLLSTRGTFLQLVDFPLLCTKLITQTNWNCILMFIMWLCSISALKQDIDTNLVKVTEWTAKQLMILIF